MVESNTNAQIVSTSRLNEVNLEAWSDMDQVQSISPSLNMNDCLNIPEQTAQENNNNKYYLPPEIMENIVCYLDGRTLFKFKQLSKACYVIADNALRFNKLWKKICLNEIPKKYFIDLLSKQFSGKLIAFGSLSELQYEMLYKNWLQWQGSVLTTTCIGNRNFLCLDEINQIICHKLHIMVILSRGLNEYYLKKNENGTYSVAEKKLELRETNTLVALHPYQCNVNEEDEELHEYLGLRQINSENVCPIHNDSEEIHDGSNQRRVISKLIDVNFNIYTKACCWVRETFYEHHPDNKEIMNVHLCNKLYGTMYTSVMHGLIVGYFRSNSIIVHNIHKDSCTTINFWLLQKYMGPSAVYIYTNILFIGTQNGFLLAYRLRCWDDFINLKDKNLLLETKLNIGRIVKLDIIDFDGAKAIIVASKSRILWLQIN